MAWQSKILFSISGSCLKQNNATYTPSNRISFFIVYELDTGSRDLDSDCILKDCLFGGIKFAKNADPDKYVYSSYGIEFYSCSDFSLSDGSMGKNIITFGANMSPSAHIDNKGKDILILGKGPTQRLDDTTLKAEAKYSISYS